MEKLLEAQISTLLLKFKKLVKQLSSNPGNRSIIRLFFVQTEVVII